MDQIIILVTTWVLGMVLHKWPDFKNEYLARALWVLAVLTQAINQAMAAAVAPIAVHTSYAVALPPIPGVHVDPTILVAGTATWIGTQLLHLGCKVLKSLGVRLPSWM